MDQGQAAHGEEGEGAAGTIDLYHALALAVPTIADMALSLTAQAEDEDLGSDEDLAADDELAVDKDLAAEEEEVSLAGKVGMARVFDPAVSRIGSLKFAIAIAILRIDDIIKRRGAGL